MTIHRSLFALWSTYPPKGRDYASPAPSAFQIGLIYESTEMARVFHRK
jgi:hypothetical protein